MDGYDKLKPYGFCIHGCVDGYVHQSVMVQKIIIITNSNLLYYRYSRKVIWFTLASSNSDPRVIVRYYLEAIEKIKLCVPNNCGIIFFYCM